MYVGHRIILPSIFTGRPRNMHKRQQDVMSYVRKYGHPDLFINTTTNSSCPEIKNNLLPVQDPQDRLGIRSGHMFKLKIQKLLSQK